MMDKFSCVGWTKYTAGTSGIGSRSELRSRWSVTPLDRSCETERSGEIMDRVCLS